MNWSPLQKREIFHLEFLRELVVKVPSSSIILKGGSNLRFFEVDYNRFRDTVVAYLDAQSQERYSQASVWDEIRLTAASVIERMAGLERKNSD